MHTAFNGEIFVKALGSVTSPSDCALVHTLASVVDSVETMQANHSGLIGRKLRGFKALLIAYFNPYLSRSGFDGPDWRISCCTATV